MATAGIDRRRHTSSERRWAGLSLALLAVVVAPIAALALSVFAFDPELWRTQLGNRLGAQILGTITVMVGVGAVALGLGASLAWLVTAYRFPGSRLLTWLLALPLAMPGYILGYVMLAVFDFTGPVQQTWRSWFGQDAWFPEVRSMPGLILVLGLVLYPYVFLLARAALKDQAGAAYQTARSLGAGPTEAARRVVFPMLRPALAASLAIVMMETLTDFATVDYFGVDTVSVGVYKLLTAAGNREAANQLALTLFGFAILVIVAERIGRGKASFAQAGRDSAGFTPQKLSGFKGLLASAACVVLLMASIGAPVLQLIFWMIQETRIERATSVSSRFLDFAGNSLLLAALTASACLLIAVTLSNNARMNPSRVTRSAVRLATLGYSLPGTVVAIGVLMVLVAIDRLTDATPLPLIVTGSVLGIVYGCTVRYLGPGLHSVESGLTQVSTSVTDSARSLGLSRVATVRRVHVPLSTSSLLTAVVLVSVDTIKELPIILLLRPFGFDTLSIWVWNLSSESRFTQAALPAIVIVLTAAVPVVYLSRRLERSTG